MPSLYMNTYRRSFDFSLLNGQVASYAPFRHLYDLTSSTSDTFLFQLLPIALLFRLFFFGTVLTHRRVYARRLIFLANGPRGTRKARK